MDFQLVLPLWKILDKNFVIPKLRGTKSADPIGMSSKILSNGFSNILSVRVTIALIDDSLFFLRDFYGLNGMLRLPL